MIMVVIVHVANYYCRAFRTIDRSSFFGAVCFNAVSRISVPIFFMISGACLLEKPYDAVKNRRRIKRTAVVLAAFTTLYFFWDKYYLHKNIKWKTLLKSPERKSLWFLYAIIGIYIALPFIKRMVDSLNPREEKLGIVLWALLNGVFKKIGISACYAVPILDGTYYLGYFILGHLAVKYAGKIVQKKKDRILLTAFSGSVLFMTVGTYFASIALGRYTGILLTYSNLLTMTASLSGFLFMYFHVGDCERKVIMNFSYLSFGIYLTHGFILDFFMKNFPYHQINAWIGVPLVSVTVVILSGILVGLCKKTNLLKRLL